MAVISLPSERTRWRCAQCGNLTRFDVVRSSRTREFWHFELSGQPTVETTEVVSDSLESVTCRWCGSSSAIELIDRPDA